MSRPPELRAADSDREQATETLRSAAAEGRLDADELEQRLEIALGARTYSELAALVADLPAPGRGAGERRPARRRGSERAAFLATAAVLVAIWALTGAEYFWPVWPILGWGVFVMGPKGAPPFGGCGARTSRHRSVARADTLRRCPPSASSMS